MNQQNNILKYLVPIVAVVVLVESVMLLMNLKDRNATKIEVAKPSEITAGANANTIVNTQPVYSIDISANSKTMKMGGTGIITVKATGNSARALDSLNLYLKYNASAFEVSKMTYDKKLPAPAFAKASTSTNLVVANFLVSEPAGLKLKQDESITLVQFQVKPLVTGNFDFEISTGNEMKESATMFVENATTKVLPFASNKLTVNVTR